VRKSRFELGQVVATPGALATMVSHDVMPISLLHRHVQGDWGKLDEHDTQANEHAVVTGLRILSSYPVGKSKNVWIITEADRSSTTILLPSEY